MIDSNPFRLTIILMLFFAFSGCGDKTQMPAAPLGKKQTLENLADAYRKTASQLSMSPTHLTPVKRRQFLEQVFSQAGYSYSDTLTALSSIEKSSINQHHKDLKQLLYLPHYDKKYQAISDIYSEEEIRTIKKIDQIFR